MLLPDACKELFRNSIVSRDVASNCDQLSSGCLFRVVLLLKGVVQHKKRHKNFEKKHYTRMNS